ncbi:MAG TPA: SRPBCC family protein [Polyangiaceae bacterium]|nr:SRPBCC family protein [Polyangiaceae bacterium]
MNAIVRTRNPESATQRPSAGASWLGVGLGVAEVVLLGSAIQSYRSSRGRTKGTALMIGAAAVGGLLAARARSAPRGRSPGGIRVSKSITVNRSPSEVYDYWRELRHLPAFMSHLESVTVDHERSTWRAKGPAGVTIEWVSELTADDEDERLAWRSLPGASIPNQGEVRFARAAGNRGTQLSVELFYEPPGGAVGAAFARLFGELPALQLESDLRRFKQILETGEVLHSDASIHSGPHPARPSAQRFEGKVAT